MSKYCAHCGKRIWFETLELAVLNGRPYHEDCVDEARDPFTAFFSPRPATRTVYIRRPVVVRPMSKAEAEAEATIALWSLAVVAIVGILGALSRKY